MWGHCPNHGGRINISASTDGENSVKCWYCLQPVEWYSCSLDGGTLTLYSFEVDPNATCTIKFVTDESA
jgi:hypothetical protein